MVDTPTTPPELVVKVALVEQKLDNFNGVFGRLENAIEKIGDVSNDIKQMLAVHEERIETMNTKIALSEEKTVVINDGVANDIKELRENINTVNRQVTQSVHDTESKILGHQNDMEARVMAGQMELKQLFQSNNEALEKRVKVLENWRYVLVGIFIVVGGVIGFVAQNTISVNAIVP